jgi:Sodium/hydrogen exchanger family
MTDQQVQLFLADLAIIILLARLLGMAARRLGQPAVLGEIIAGILLGPTLFHGKITETLFPATVRPPLTALATLTGRRRRPAGPAAAGPGLRGRDVRCGPPALG